MRDTVFVGSPAFYKSGNHAGSALFDYIQQGFFFFASHDDPVANLIDVALTPDTELGQVIHLADRSTGRWNC